MQSGVSGSRGAWRTGERRGAALSRRWFLHLTGAGAAGMAFGGTLGKERAEATLGTEYGGQDLSGWSVIVGDGVWSAASEPPVGPLDVETRHLGTHSELRANIRHRHIQAHNITLWKLERPDLLQYVHVCSYEFRLPFAPTADSTTINGQTIEGGISMWDGAATRQRYGVYFQWIINPHWVHETQQEWGRYGYVRTWTGRGGGSWQPIGRLVPDQDWHSATFIIDHRSRASAVLIDGEHWPSCFAVTRGPADWGTEIAVALTAEAISVDPRGLRVGALHRAEVRNWNWRLEARGGGCAYLPWGGRR